MLLCVGCVFYCVRVAFVNVCGVVFVVRDFVCYCVGVVFVIVWGLCLSLSFLFGCSNLIT